MITKKIFNRIYTIKRSDLLLKCLSSRRHFKCKDELCLYCGKEKRENLFLEIYDYFKNSNTKLWAITLLDPNDEELENISKYHLENLSMGIWLKEINFRKSINLNWYDKKCISHYHGIVSDNENPSLAMHKIWHKFRQVHVQEIWDLSGWINYMVKMNIDVHDNVQLRWLDKTTYNKKIIKF